MRLRFAFLLWGLTIPVAFPCTTFLMEDEQLVFGNSLDWYQDHGVVLVNSRGLSKSGYLLRPDLVQPAQWISRYGSVTFNQVSREFPYGGVNEAGLLVETMMLNESVYPPLDPLKPAVSESQWIQFMLDSANSTQEVINLTEQVQIQNIFAPLHYLVCDASRDCATIEFINGAKVIHRSGEGLPYSALTNDTYENSLDFLRMHEGFGGSAPIPTSSDSLSRFVIAVFGSHQPSGTQPVRERAFDILANVIQSNTQWNLVYEPDLARVNFRTRSHAEVKSLRYDEINFDCRSSGMQALIMNQPGSGDLTRRLIPYTVELNTQMVRQSEFLPTILQDKIIDFTSQAAACL